MSILLDEAQRAIAAESARQLGARTKTEALLTLLGKRASYDSVFWDTAKEQGWTGIALPEEAGGLGLSLVELGLVSKACGTAVAGAPFIISSYGGARAILDFGDDALKAQWLRPLASGEAIGAVAFAEGPSPCPRTSAVMFSNGKLTGVKPAVCGGAHANVAVVLANEDGAPVLVAVALDGVARETFNTFDNSRCTANLVFDASPAALMASGQEALDAALHILTLQSVVVAFEQTGGAEAMMLRARDYANTRRAFGQLIGAFQSVKHRIAELYALVELARANALHAASCEGHAGFLKAAAAARLSATEAYDTAARDCMQIHGGIGVTWEAGIHLHQRRARALAIEQGNGQFWEDILVDQLLKEAA